MTGRMASVWSGLTLANCFWAWLVTGDYVAALDRSIWQAVGLIAVAVSEGMRRRRA